MGFKLGVFAAFAILVAPSIVNAEDAGVHVHYSAIEYLQNFALSVCISHGYKSEEVVKDSLAAAGGYLELGSYPMEASEEVAALSKRFLAKKYTGINADRLTLMKRIAAGITPARGSIGNPTGLTTCPFEYVQRKPLRASWLLS